jgi:hypothetical protein
MFKNKHSGWTWDLKRTPFGGGGGGFVSAITDPISSALGTDGGGGGVLGGLASIDPGPAIGSGLAELDKGVNQIPGGWYTLGALAAGGTGLAFAPEIAAAAGIGANTAITSAAGQQAFFDALASGAASTEAINAGVAADAVANGIGLGTNAALQGPTYGELGITGVPEGGMGPTYGEMGYTGLNQQAGIDAANFAENLQQAKDALNTANQVRQGVGAANTLSKLLTSGAGSSLTGAAQNLATGQTGVGSAIPALIRGNVNPFLQLAQQPIRSTSPDLAALANLLKQG